MAMELFEVGEATMCVHHWIIDEYNIGTCKKCGEVRAFGVLQEKNRLMLAERQAEIARHPAGHSERRGRKPKAEECAYEAFGSPAGDPDCGQASSAIAIQVGSSARSVAIKELWQNPEFRAKVSAALTGRHPTAETKAKISAALTRRHNKKG